MLYASSEPKREADSVDPQPIRDRSQHLLVIPVFPEFKPLELADRAAVEAVVHCFPPYSDFSFTNLYAWRAQVSSLHGNLAVQFADYLWEPPALTFIGHHRLVETAKQLLALAKAQCHPAVLRVIPACIAQLLTKAGFSVTEDDAANDYVYSVKHLASMHEWAGHHVCHSIRRFAARHPNYTIRHAPLHAIDTDEFRALFALWAKRKRGTSPQISHEHRAFERFLRLGDSNIEAVGLYVDSRLIGFSSFELMPGDTAIVHFSKTDHAFHSGVGDILNWEEAKHLHARGVTLYNWEQDLGLQGLRQSKMKYQPCNFLRKFSVHAPPRSPE